jgi:hypothetical protein
VEKKVDRSGALREDYGMGSLSVVRARVAAALVLTLGLVLTAALASTYFGHATSPYGVCYGSSGRSIPCALAKAGPPSQRP